MASLNAADALIQRLSKTPFNHPYDDEDRYFLCQVKRSSGKTSFGVVSEKIIRRASKDMIQVNVWSEGFPADANSMWPSSAKKVSFQDLLAWNPTANLE